jgi:hypothetical protein
MRQHGAGEGFDLAERHRGPSHVVPGDGRALYPGTHTQIAHRNESSMYDMMERISLTLASDLSRFALNEITRMFPGT